MKNQYARIGKTYQKEPNEKIDLVMPSDEGLLSNTEQADVQLPVQLNFEKHLESDLEYSKV